MLELVLVLLLLLLLLVARRGHVYLIAYIWMYVSS